MNLYAVPHFLPLLPELVLALAALLLLVIGVSMRPSDHATREISWLSVVVLVVVLLLAAAPMIGSATVDGLLGSQGAGTGRQTAMFGMFVVDGFGAYMKVLVLLGSVFSIILSLRYNESEAIARFEYPVLVLLATVGMMAMISANDFLALYVGLELQSLALYVLASFARDATRSTESGLKYFVLGALASGMLLYGISMVYGFSGTVNFDDLGKLFANGGTAPVLLVIGIVFIAVGLAFKVSAVPFHMWTPDVYEGAPTPVTAFFSVAPKIAALTLFVRVMVGPFGPLVQDWHPILWFISAASMLLGAFAALNQRSIKRLMAYSSIGHAGYALIGLAAATSVGVRGIVIYLAIYLFMNLGTFAVILSMRRDGKAVETIQDLAGLSRNQPAVALALAIFMFSMAGIPPLAGFFSKFYIFMAAIEAPGPGMVTLAVIGVLTSVVGAFYYLRIVKLMYFDEPAAPFDRPIGGEVQTVMLVSAVIVVFFCVWPGAVVSGADTVAASLFAG
jgi:NADH-quinone oxidoreductase subunit N